MKINVLSVLSVFLVLVTKSATAVPSTRCMATRWRRARESRKLCICGGNKVKGLKWFELKTMEKKQFPGYCNNSKCNKCRLTQKTRKAVREWRALPEDTCTNEPCGPSSHGDPHFTTWDGTQYSYHGECDLVMANSPSFASGQGLRVHIRTTIAKSYSYIASVALQIGTDVLEVSAGNFFFNGKENYLPLRVGGFRLMRKRDCKSFKQTLPNGVVADLCTNQFEIVLDNDSSGEESSTSGSIHIRTFREFLAVRLHTPSLLENEDAVGMMGSPGTGLTGMVDRDGISVLTDPNAMGAAWQVRDDEPMLFQQQEREPQYPATCILPPEAVATGRHLREREFQQQAKEACRELPEDYREACIFDIVQTGDVSMAVPHLEDDF